VGAERQTYIKTYIHTNIQTHTHFSESNFGKPGACPGNQAHAEGRLWVPPALTSGNKSRVFLPDVAW